MVDSRDGAFVEPLFAKTRNDVVLHLLQRDACVALEVAYIRVDHDYGAPERGLTWDGNPSFSFLAPANHISFNSDFGRRGLRLCRSLNRGPVNQTRKDSIGYLNPYSFGGSSDPGEWLEIQPNCFLAHARQRICLQSCSFYCSKL